MCIRDSPFYCSWPLKARPSARPQKAGPSRPSPLPKKGQGGEVGGQRGEGGRWAKGSGALQPSWVPWEGGWRE
eukprot:12871678-Alexandrium_andersonii.AAC.1